MSLLLHQIKHKIKRDILNHFRHISKAEIYIVLIKVNKQLEYKDTPGYGSLQPLQ